MHKKITRETFYVDFASKNFKGRLRLHSPSPFLKIMRTRSPSSSKFSNTKYSGRILESINLHCSTLTEKDPVTENVKSVKSIKELKGRGGGQKREEGRDWGKGGQQFAQVRGF